MTIEYHNAKLLVQTDLLRADVQITPGKFFQFLGELERNTEQVRCLKDYRLLILSYATPPL